MKQQNKDIVIHTTFALTALLASLTSAHADSSMNAQTEKQITQSPVQATATQEPAQQAVSTVSTPLAHTSQVDKQPSLPIQQAWLGVALTTVPPVLAKQLADIIPQNQGVMLQSVSPHSPAAKAGLQPYDVIISMDDQKILSAKQLVQLVHTAKPESSVTLKIIHQGKPKVVNVTLGKHAAPSYAHHNPSLQQHYQGWPQMYQPMPMHPMTQQMMQAMKAPATIQPNNGKTSSKNLAWDSFESVQVRTLEDGRYHAKVIYKDEKGNVKHFTFEGKQDEITQNIKKQADLPEAKKQALLNALNMNIKPDALLNQPIFRGNPFNDPFFQQGFQGFPMMPAFNAFLQPLPAVPMAQPQGNAL